MHLEQGIIVGRHLLNTTLMKGRRAGSAFVAGGPPSWWLAAQ
jgi:hypothetical protein